jgi:hypothetical protein
MYARRGSETSVAIGFDSGVGRWTQTPTFQELASARSRPLKTTQLASDSYFTRAFEFG